MPPWQRSRSLPPSWMRSPEGHDEFDIRIGLETDDRLARGQGFDSDPEFIGVLRFPFSWQTAVRGLTALAGLGRWGQQNATRTVPKQTLHPDPALGAQLFQAPFDGPLAHASRSPWQPRHPAVGGCCCESPSRYPTSRSWPGSRSSTIAATLQSVFYRFRRDTQTTS